MAPRTIRIATAKRAGEDTSQQDNSQDGEGESQTQEEAMLAAQPETSEGESPDEASDDETEGE